MKMLALQQIMIVPKDVDYKKQLTLSSLIKFKILSKSLTK